MATVVVRASTHVGPVARRFASADPNQIIVQELRRSTIPKLVRIYRRAAPFRTGRMRRNIGARGGGRVVQIFSAARSDEGYPYTGVTRFGHHGRIYPKHAKALAFKIGGRTIIRTSVAGYHPGHDWAQEAFPQALEEVHAGGGRIGRALVRRLL